MICSRINVMKIYLQIIILTVVALNLTAGVVPSAVSDNMEKAGRVGEARVNILFWDLYDISLYAEESRFVPDKPFALRLKYLRDIKGKVIAEKSVEEMRRQGISEVKLAGWYVQLEELFPDVQEGTELIAIFEPGKSTRFYQENRYMGQILDADFSHPFSQIWLGEESSLPRIRTELLGRNASQ